MKISALIERLSELHGKHEDVDVHVEDVDETLHKEVKSVSSGKFFDKECIWLKVSEY